MLDTSITDHNALPQHLRPYPSYDYLTTRHQSYWHHAVDVAHQLLTTFRETYGHEAYFHDQFLAHFKDALKHTDIDPNAEILGPISLNLTLSKQEKETDPQWIAYHATRKALATGPRGTAMVLKISNNDGEHWEANAHAGGGIVMNCGNLQRGKIAATREQIMDNIIEQEANMARNQAEQEQIILANYARIRKLNLCPGMVIQNYMIMHEGKRRKMRFVLSEIHENGQVHLIEGKLRGCSTVFTTTIDAVMLTLTNTDPAAAKAQPEEPRHPLSLGIF